MPDFDYLIIGGGIAGTTAAETIRQKDKNGRIAILSSEPHFLYSRVLLPEFIRGEVGLEKVMLRNAEDYRKNGVEIFLGEEVEKLNMGELSLKTKSGKEFKAKKILIASGGRPKPWNLNTSSPKNIFRLQTLGDAERIKKFLSGRGAGEAVIIGGGFMALEFIETLIHYGWRIKLLCAKKSFWPGFFDERGYEILSGVWSKNGVETVFNGKITSNGGELTADFVGVGIGLERNLDFMPHLVVGQLSGGVQVNEYLETGTSNVWAAGDVARYPDPFSGRKRIGGNWSGAFMQGRTAGFNMTGSKERFKTISVYSIGHLGLNITFIGDIGPFAKGDISVSKGFAFASGEKNEYVRISTKDNRVTGAVLINGQSFLGIINQAIMNKWDISSIFKKSI